MTDQQRGDCMGLDPHSPSCLQTPNLDWLARTGHALSSRLLRMPQLHSRAPQPDDRHRASG